MQNVRLVVSVWVALVCASCGGGEPEPTPADDATGRSGELAVIAIHPSGAAVLVGQTQQFTATAVFADQTRRDVTSEVTWSSSDDSATISNLPGTQGLATARPTSYIRTAAISASMAGVTASAALTTTLTAVVSVAVTSSSATAVALTKHQFRAVATYSDGRTEDVTERAYWQAYGSALATFAFDHDLGEADLLAPGDLTVQATFDNRFGFADLVVTEAALASFVVTPGSVLQPLGEDVEFHAIATLAGGGTRDLTQVVSWRSSDPSVAPVTAQGSAQAIALGTTTIQATYGSYASDSMMTVTPPVVRVINVAPAEAEVAPGATQAFSATGFLSDRTPVVLTDAIWRSSNPAVATVSATGVATGVGPGTTVITAEVGTAIGSATLHVLGPTVVTTFPGDGAVDVRPTTSIVVRFDRAMAHASVTVQAQDGPCSGSLQLSGDDFATCRGFAGAVTFDAAGTLASAQPNGLTASTPWKVRVTSDATSTTGAAVGAYVHTVGFTLAAGACGPRLQVSQIYSGGGNADSSFDADFIELHNTGATEIELFGYSVQYAVAGSSEWTNANLPGHVLPAGGYFLIAVLRDRPSANLPSVDYSLLIGEMSPAIGKVAVVSNLQTLPGVCPIDLTNDLVGYGSAACFEGAAPAGALGNTLAALRGVDGCGDTGNNAADFALGAPAPRNAASPPHVCACPGGLAERRP